MKTNILKGALCVAPLLGISFTNPLWSGNYSDIYGAHPAAGGMGNAVTSRVNDSSAVYYNVAGLGRLSRGDHLMSLTEQRYPGVLESKEPPTRVDRSPEGDKKSPPPAKTAPTSAQAPIAGRPRTPVHEVALSYNYARPRLKTTAPLNQDIDGVNDDFAVLGLTINFNSVFDFDRVVRFGLNAIVPATGNLITINDLNPTVHRYLQQGVSNQKPTIMGGLGFEVIKDMLFAGVGFTTSVKGKAGILMKDVPISPSKEIPNQQVIMEIKPHFTETSGIMFEYKRFTAGFSYRRESFVALNDLSARAQTQLLGIQLDFDLALLDLFSPRTYSYGLGYRLTERITLSADINREIWSVWSKYRTDFANFTGNLPLSRTKQTYSEDLFLSDVTVYRAGIEFQLKENIALRAGFTRKPSALPVEGGAINWMDSDRTIFTLGGSYTLMPSGGRLKKPITLDLVLEHQRLKDRAVLKISPTTRAPHYYSYGGKIWRLGLSTTFLF